jgi:hypothetical protein
MMLLSGSGSGLSRNLNDSQGRPEMALPGPKVLVRFSAEELTSGEQPERERLTQGGRSVP